MSCLSKSHRISKDSVFKHLFQHGKRWHTPSFVAYFKSSKNLNIAFVASKKVGNSVKRNLAKRRIKALCIAHEKTGKITQGQFIFVLKNEIHSLDYQKLHRDFIWAIDKVQKLQ